jgi:hypothetical protein
MRHYVPPKRRRPSTSPYGFTSQKMVLFISSDGKLKSNRNNICWTWGRQGGEYAEWGLTGFNEVFSERAWRFGGICRTHHQDSWMSQARNQQKLAANWVQLSLLPWKWRRNILPKRRVLSVLHGVTTEKTVLLNVIFVRTSKVSLQMKGTAPER